MIPMERIRSVKLTGTTPSSTTASNTVVNYPLGFTRDNCYVSAIGVEIQSDRPRFNDPNYPVAAIMLNSEIQVYIRDNAAASKPFIMILTQTF